MSDIVDTKVKTLFFVIVFVLGLILGFFGLVFGNNPITKANLVKYKAEVQKEKISNCDLVRWIEQGKRDYFLVGFRKPEDYKKNGRIKTSNCTPVEKLDDVGWLRRRFPYLKVPLVIYGRTDEDGLNAAAKMRYYGYNAYMLEGGYEKFVKDFKTTQSKKSVLCADEQKDPSLRKNRIIYFTGSDTNLGKKKKAACDNMPKGMTKKAAIAVEGC